MIFQNKDIIYCDEIFIAHGCNAKGVMNSGVAKSIRKNFSQAYKDYRKKFDTHGLILGENVWSLSNNKIIINCITQGSYGYDGKAYVDYDAIRSCMRDIHDRIKVLDISEKDKKVAMPYIGAGRGGGDWEQIREIIEYELGNILPVVYYIEE